MRTSVVNVDLGYMQLCQLSKIIVKLKLFSFQCNHQLPVMGLLHKISTG